MASFESLRARVQGELITPASTEYDTARRLWNGLIDKRPSAILRCRNAADVVAGVQYAAETDSLLAIRGGGHNVAGLAMCDGGLVLDLSPMRSAEINPAARRIRAEAGMRWADFDAETQRHGLATTGGLISSTGIAGLTLGGGYGWLMGRYGLACDNVVSFEVVTADGVLRTASAEENPDLYWALRGGGGNFGVVTSFEYRLHPVSTVLSGMVLHPLEKAREVLRFFRDFVQEIPDELIVYAGALTTPDGLNALALVPFYCGEDLEEGTRLLQPLRGFGSPVADTVGPMPYLAVQQMLDPAAPFGIRSYWKSTFLKSLTDEAIDTFVTHSSLRTSPLSVALIEHYHGALERVAPEDTAVSLRAGRFDFVIMGLWDSGEAEPHIQWTRNFFAAMQPHSAGSVYVNALDADETSRVREAYGANYARLVEVKQRYDPANLFRMNHNIRPAGAAGVA